MSRDLARATIGLHRSRDSAIVQFVLALEKASVAAVKMEISIVFDGAVEDLPLPGCTGSSMPEVLEGISLGS